MRDELAHEAALQALGRRHTLRDARKFPAFVRTIARRLRSHATREALKRGELSIDREDIVREELMQPQRDGTLLRVRNALVERDVLLTELDRMLTGLTCLNRRILLSYYEGFSCAELAARFEMAEESVKVRIHRARRKLRQLFERRVCSLTGEFRTDG
ncbi:MAG: RNA polymerase sigma factor [Planctomycetota bacterium]